MAPEALDAFVPKVAPDGDSSTAVSARLSQAPKTEAEIRDTEISGAAGDGPDEVASEGGETRVTPVGGSRTTLSARGASFAPLRSLLCVPHDDQHCLPAFQLPEPHLLQPLSFLAFALPLFLPCHLSFPFPLSASWKLFL